MRKGLTQALIAVAVVTLAMRAMAMAPVIGNIPDIIIGNETITSPPNTFVYPDAINLSNFVTDLDANGNSTDPATIMWSYEFVNQTPKYRINNVDQLSGSDDPTNPPANKLIGGTGSQDLDPAGNLTDGKITVRNINLSPLPSGPNTDPGTTGTLASETQVLTLFASDGTTYSSKSIMVYTDDGGNDRLSPPLALNVYSETFDAHGVAGYGWFVDGGAITSSYDSTNGALCIQTALGGNNIAKWTGPYGMLPLVGNAVYRIRASINTNQASKPLVPFWDLIINSYGYVNPTAGQTNPASPLHGLNLYGANYMFLSNTGNANAAVSGSTTDFTLWWCPSPVATAQWNDISDAATKPGPFAPSNAADKDAFIEFRILDADANTGTNSAAALGTLCLTGLTIDRFDLGTAHVVNHVVLPTDAPTNLTQAGIDTNSGGGNTRVSTYSTFTASFSGGAVTVTPTATAAALAEVQPGDFTFDVTYANAALVTDNYPVHMTPNTLYRIQLGMSAPSTAAADAPMDLFWLGADTTTNELICLSYVTLNAWHHGMPKTGTPQTYTAFFFSNNASASSNPAHYSNFRWRWMGGSNGGLGGGGEPNTGGITIHSVNVDEVAFP